MIETNQRYIIDMIALFRQYIEIDEHTWYNVIIELYN